MSADAQQVPLLGCTFNAVTRAGVREWARQTLFSGETRLVTTVNVAILMMMRRDKLLRSFIEQSDLTVVDGQPIVWLSRLMGAPLPERVTGIDLCDDLSSVASECQSRLYLLGGTTDVITATRSRLSRLYPDLNIVGVRDGYFDWSEAPQVAAAIQESQADILLVGMGVPRQERFLNDYCRATGVKIALPVGGSFDVLAGEKRRAPKPIQDTGLEWLFRLLQEPRRLFWRYATTNTQFLGLAVNALTKRWVFKAERKSEFD